MQAIWCLKFWKMTKSGGQYCIRDSSSLPMIYAHGPKEQVLDGGRDSPPGRGNFGGCPAHWKAFGVSAAVYAAKGVIQSSITARHAMKLFAKILWPIVSCYFLFFSIFLSYRIDAIIVGIRYIRDCWALWDRPTVIVTQRCADGENMSKRT